MKRAWLGVAIIVGALYPLLVYFGLHALPPFIFVLIALILLGVRIWTVRKTNPSPFWGALFAMLAIVMLFLWLLDGKLAVKSYPIIMSLTVAAIFGFSLIFPPTVIERLARIKEPNLPQEGVLYTRRVTWIWVAYLLVNSLISLATALWGSLEQWTLWNGLLSYCCMGALLGGEFLLRKKIRK